ncbi:hypothetical protein PhCBS80983_g03162 [Powellomyces hirtus]|uniref:DMAP1-binding domain-containing protein n=1 Tax=Powellomyces hirtus TaxID=109895 RepID=A0A507E2S4_9FUNG|nr:hypothetical protein PhCBS80983_g03162 [Powellomyces hirtus]
MDSLPPAIAERLRALEEELADGDITQQGFEKKRKKLLEPYGGDGVVGGGGGGDVGGISPSKPFSPATTIDSGSQPSTPNEPKGRTGSDAVSASTAGGGGGFRENEGYLVPHNDELRPAQFGSWNKRSGDRPSRGREGDASADSPHSRQSFASHSSASPTQYATPPPQLQQPRYPVQQQGYYAPPDPYGEYRPPPPHHQQHPTPQQQYMNPGYRPPYGYPAGYPQQYASPPQPYAPGGIPGQYHHAPAPQGYYTPPQHMAPPMMPRTQQHPPQQASLTRRSSTGSGSGSLPHQQQHLSAQHSLDRRLSPQHSRQSSWSDASGFQNNAQSSAATSPSQTPHSISREGSLGGDHRVDEYYAAEPDWSQMAHMRNNNHDQGITPVQQQLQHIPLGHAGETGSMGSIASPITPHQPQQYADWNAVDPSPTSALPPGAAAALANYQPGWRGTIRIAGHSQPRPTPLHPFLDPRFTKKYGHVPALLGKQALPTRRRLQPPTTTDKYTGATLNAFPTIASLLRFRAQKQPKQIAFTVTDHKGRDVASITYEKLNARAEKVAQTIKDKSSLKRGDAVALLYRRSEAIESVVALYGCLYAGMVAVPIVTSSMHVDDELTEIVFILDSCKISLALTTDLQLKTLTREFNVNRNTPLPKIEWWKSTDITASSSSKKKNGPDTAVTVNSAEIAYIEYSKNAAGELKGVVMDHHVILSQCLQMKALHGLESTDVLVAAVESRVGLGLMATAFAGVCAGCSVVWLAEAALQYPGGWIMAVTRHKATVALMDNPALMDIIGVVFTSASASAKKQPPPDLSSLRAILVNSPLQHPSFLDDVERCLREHGLTKSRTVIIPLLSLDEFGGTALATREPGNPAAHRIDIWIDAAAFRENRVRVLAYTTPDGTIVGDVPNEDEEDNEDATAPRVLRLTDAGSILPEISVAIVDPETGALQPPNVLGEIWCNAQECLPRSFKNLAPLSEQVFRNHPLLYVKEDPQQYHPSHDHEQQALGFRIEVIDSADFIKTGLLGFIIDGNAVPGVTAPRLFVAGIARDRLLQRKLKLALERSDKPRGYLRTVEEFDAHFATDMIESVFRHVPGVLCCAIFTVYKHGEHLPVVICEAARSAAEYRTVAAQIADVLRRKHGVRTYTVCICAAGSLPRTRPQTTAGTQIQTTFHGYSSGVVTIPLAGGGSGGGAFQPPPLPRSSSTKSAVVPAQDIGKRKLELLDIEMCHMAFLSGELRVAHLYMDVEKDVVSTVGRGPNDLAPPPIEPRHAKVGQVVGGMAQIPLLDDKTGADLEQFPTISHILAHRGNHGAVTASPAFTVLDHKGRESSKHPITFAKASNKVRSLAHHLLTKRGLKPHDHVVLMYAVGVDYLYALHACLYAGIVPIPLSPLDLGRLHEDVPALLNVVDRFNVKAVLSHSVVEETLKSKVVVGHVKAIRAAAAAAALAARSNAGPVAASSRKTSVPNAATLFPVIVNTVTSKIQKLGKPMALDDPEFYHGGMTIPLDDEEDGSSAPAGSETIDQQHGHTTTRALVLVHFDADMRAVFTTFTHASILAQLRIQAIHSSLTASTLEQASNATHNTPPPLLACVGTYSGLGFLYATLLGPYIGTHTLYITPSDFFQLPHLWFETAFKHRVRDAFVTTNMMEHAMACMKNAEYRAFSLHLCKNLMIPANGRARVDVYRLMHQNFLANRLEDLALATTFAPPINPLVATRGYMRAEVTTLGLDCGALREGVVKVRSSVTGENGRVKEAKEGVLFVQDCGKIANNTVVAIVEPATMTLVGPNRVGAIYVCSPGTVSSAPTTPINGLDAGLLFSPTGFTGFLHPISQPNPTGPAVVVHDASHGHHFDDDGADEVIPDPWDTLVLAGLPYDIVLFVLGATHDEMRIQVVDGVADDDAVRNNHQQLQTDVNLTSPSTPSSGVVTCHWKEDVERTVEAVWNGIGACVVHQTSPTHITLILESPLETTQPSTYTAPTPIPQSLDAAIVNTPSSTSSLTAAGTTTSASQSTAATGFVRHHVNVVNNLALIPMVVHAVLETHGFLIAEVVVLKTNALARSRTGEKMRERVADAWRSGKLPVVTSFSVRPPSANTFLPPPSFTPPSAHPQSHSARHSRASSVNQQQPQPVSSASTSTTTVTKPASQYEKDDDDDDLGVVNRSTEGMSVLSG